LFKVFRLNKSVHQINRVYSFKILGWSIFDDPSILVNKGKSNIFLRLNVNNSDRINMLILQFHVNLQYKINQLLWRVLKI